MFQELNTAWARHLLTFSESQLPAYWLGGYEGVWGGEGWPLTGVMPAYAVHTSTTTVPTRHSLPLGFPNATLRSQFKPGIPTPSLFFGRQAGCKPGWTFLKTREPWRVQRMRGGELTLGRQFPSTLLGIPPD